MKEIIYIVGCKDKDGRFNKLVKCQSQWWHDKQEAVQWLECQEDWFRIMNSVFELKIDVGCVLKVYDGKDTLEDLYKLVKEHGLKGFDLYKDAIDKIKYEN